ncbi:MAG: toll/interleukin-1 receptor domain-containing protein [Actinophytocola sp.]|uniref:toll/interleukin-1 receptor domain-containing protein n=1 Tax=Actinophytocola sp. TaxID=1872138 RepID=UPI003C769D1D
MSQNFQFGGEIYNVSGSHNVGKMNNAQASPEPAQHTTVPPGSNVVWPEPLVFVNYRSADEKPAADVEAELNHRLGRGAVFRDVHMPLGVAFPSELADRAARCAVMVSIIGERWDDGTGLRLLHSPSDWVRRELATALAGGVHVVPILVGARPHLSPADLPEEVRALAYIQGPHLPRDYTAPDLRRVVDRLLKTLPPLATAMYRATR